MIITNILKIMSSLSKHLKSGHNPYEQKGYVETEMKNSLKAFCCDFF